MRSPEGAGAEFVETEAVGAGEDFFGAPLLFLDLFLASLFGAFAAGG